MKGTILDFLKLAAEKAELARELVALAAKHGFEFTEEVSDEELEGVAGGSTELIPPAIQDVRLFPYATLKQSYEATESALADQASKLQSFEEGKDATRAHVDSLRDAKSAG